MRKTIPFHIALKLIWLKSIPFRLVATLTGGQAIVREMEIVYSVRGGPRKTQRLSGPWPEVWVALKRIGRQ